MIELPKLEGKDWDRLARRPYEYAIEGEGYKEPCSLEQALEWAKQRAGATDKPVRLAVLWSGEWWLVDIVCPSEFLTLPVGPARQPAATTIIETGAAATTGR